MKLQPQTSSTAFVMHSAREAIAAGLEHIEEQVTAIERAVVENPALAFDLARTLIESVCRTILAERGIEFSKHNDVPRLFRMVTEYLPLLPPAVSGEAGVRDSLTKTLNGLSMAIQGICELRNRCGFASHGYDRPRPAMDSVQALMVAQAADTIVGFLYRVHRQDQALPSSPEISYAENAAFNKFVDEQYGSIRIFDLEFWASQVLFQMDPIAYQNYAAEFDENAEDDETSTGTTSEAGL